MLVISQEVGDALRDGLPVVALESTVLAHGLPYPRNLEVARLLERTRSLGALVREGCRVEAVRDGGVVLAGGERIDAGILPWLRPGVAGSGALENLPRRFVVLQRRSRHVGIDRAEAPTGIVGGLHDELDPAPLCLGPHLGHDGQATIGGRAGRFGHHERGHVGAMNHRDAARNTASRSRNRGLPPFRRRPTARESL